MIHARPKSRRYLQTTVFVSVLLVLVLMLSLVPLPAQAASPAPQAPLGQNRDKGLGLIRLKAATLDPQREQALNLPDALTVRAYAPEERGYYIVQFAGPVRAEWKAQVSALGAELLDYLPEFAFKVRMTPAQALQVQQLPSVAWMGLFQPAFKLSPGLKRDGTNVYRVQVERGIDAALTAVAIAQTGADVLQRHRNVLLVAADATQVDAMARVLDVAWIENFVLYEKHNEYGAGVILGANTANANGYDGSTQIAAVADTGLGDGTPDSAHPDIPAERITAIHSWSTEDLRFCYRLTPDGAQDVSSGHGTHVALSVVGDGGASGEGRGAAPAANLVFQAVEEYVDFYGLCQDPTLPDGYYLLGIPTDLRDLFQEAYNDGARIHANSWGSSIAGEYTEDSAAVDDFIWNNPDMAITFSAGNAGTDSDADGVVDEDSIGSPATAKNVITIGASENDRDGNYQCDTTLQYTSRDAYQENETCSSMNGQNILGTYGGRWPDDYPAEPLASDVTAGNAEQMASFSSRGPTDDGRIKPDVVAPGTWVLSGYSPLHREGYGDPLNAQDGTFQLDGWGMPQNEQYKYFGGTSMSNPLAAGAATVVRDYYSKTQGVSASAALVKATLINSAVDLLDENNDGVDDNAFPIPNMHEGWGRVDLANATDGSHLFVDDTEGVNTGEAKTYGFTVDEAGDPLKISLVWSDPAAAASASFTLVSDLDITVISPSGELYYGNIFTGGWSEPGGFQEATNNLENVYIQAAEAGTWTVQVYGFNTPIAAQPFALVVDNADAQTSPPDVPPTIGFFYPFDGEVVSGIVPIELYADDAEDGPESLLVEWNVNGGPWEPATFDDLFFAYTAEWDTTGVAEGAYTLNARATDSAGNATETSITVTVSSAPQATIHVADLDGNASSRGRRWTASVTATVVDTLGLPVAGAEVSGLWGTSGFVSCETDINGQCQVYLFGISSQTRSVSFMVTDLYHPIYPYDPSLNSDPDGDSDGTTISISRPGRARSNDEAGGATGVDEYPVYLPIAVQSAE